MSSPSDPETHLEEALVSETGHHLIELILKMGGCRSSLKPLNQHSQKASRLLIYIYVYVHPPTLRLIRHKVYGRGIMSSPVVTPGADSDLVWPASNSHDQVEAHDVHHAQHLDREREPGLLGDAAEEERHCPAEEDALLTGQRGQSQPELRAGGGRGR